MVYLIVEIRALDKGGRTGTPKLKTDGTVCIAQTGNDHFFIH
jgi:hypothetical protein